MNGFADESGCATGNSGRKSKPSMIIYSDMGLIITKLGSTRTQGKAIGESPTARS